MKEVHVICTPCAVAFERGETPAEAGEEFIDGLDAKCCGCGAWVRKWWRCINCAPGFEFDRCREKHIATRGD